MVKRILRKHGYPPDLQDEATKTVQGVARSERLQPMAAGPTATPIENR